MTWGRLLTLSLLLLTLSGFGALVAMRSVSALSTRFFDDLTSNCDLYAQDPSNGTQCGRNVRLLAVKTTKVPNGVTSARVYFKGINPAVASTYAGLQITISGRSWCPNATGNRGVNNRDVRQNGYYENHKPAVGTDVTAFQVIGAGGVAVNNLPAGDYRQGAAYCEAGGAYYNGTYNVYASYLRAVPGISGVYFVEIRATPVGQTGARNGFTISESGPAAHLSVVASAEYKSSTQAYNFTFVNGDSSLDGSGFAVSNSHNEGRNNSYAAKFGADCGVSAAGENTSMVIYDPDFVDTPASGQIRTALIKIDGSDGKTYILTGNYFSGNGAWAAFRSGTSNRYVPSLSEGHIIPAPRNAVQKHIYWHAEKGDRYLFYLMDVRPDLINQIGVPYDGIYYTTACPATNHAPTGTLTATCNADHSQNMTMNFSDADGATTASLYAGSSTTPVANGTNRASGSVIPIGTVPAGRPYTMKIRDVGTGASATPTSVTAVTRDCSQVVSCDAQPSDTVEVGNPFSVNVNGHFPFGATGPVQVSAVRFSATYNGSSQSDTVVGLGIVNAASGYNPSGSLGFTAPANIIHPTVPDSTTVTMSYTMVPGGIGSVTCDLDVEVSALPYLSVYGGDVEAGNGPGADNCQDTSAGISGWNLGNTNNFAGAGTQFGAQAMNIITGFASAQRAPSGAGNYYLYPGYGMSFANNQLANVSGDKYGGKFNSSEGCAYTIPATTAQAPFSGLTSVARGDHKVEYVVNQDVYIRNHIVYATSGGSFSVDDIPSYTLIVKGGNIYIDSSVDELDGLYVAEPKANGDGGEIFTCATAASQPCDLVHDLNGNLGPATSTQLKVYGSFVAKRVHFLRSSGTRSKAVGDLGADRANNAGEVFYYGPEQWLGQRGSGALKPQAITSLPPTL